MIARERVCRTLRFQTPDRIPRQLWIMPSAFLAHGPKLIDLLRQYPVDINPRKLEIPELPPLYRKGTFIDEWGSTWLNLQDGVAGEVKLPAVAEWSDLPRLKPPALQGVEVEFQKLSAHCPDAFHSLVAGALFERLQYLRGTENLYIDLLDQPQSLFTLRNIVMDHLMQRIEIALQCPCDAVQFADDWGSQRALLISPALWREFFKPCYRMLFERVKSAGKFVFMHSDGFIVDIIEDLIELGVDALNCQVWAMGPERLKPFRGRLTFWGELDRQWLLPKGTPADIRRRIHDMTKTLSTPMGGLIAQSEIDALTPIENIEAVLQPWR